MDYRCESAILTIIEPNITGTGKETISDSSISGEFWGILEREGRTSRKTSQTISATRLCRVCNVTGYLSYVVTLPGGATLQQHFAIISGVSMTSSSLMTMQ